MLTLLLLAGMALGGFVVWWLFFETEGAYLGKRVVIALYDLYAGRYDRIKQFDELDDLRLISEPLLHAIAPRSDPLILDVATGTGRLPLVMARNGRFDGFVLGVDASGRMLDVARAKVAAERLEDFIALMRQDASRLPFPDASFDIATCLEALEFMPDPKVALAEMARVLRPGGILLVTIRIDTRWMPGRVWSETRMRSELESLDMREIQFAIWQEDYSQVWAQKAGDSSPIGRSGWSSLRAGLGEVAILHEPQTC